MARYCSYDDREVREPRAAEKVIGKDVPRGTWVHVGGTDKEVPGCGRPFLREEQTYTIGESGYERTSEPQY